MYKKKNKRDFASVQDEHDETNSSDEGCFKFKKNVRETRSQIRSNEELFNVALYGNTANKRKNSKVVPKENKKNKKFKTQSESDSESSDSPEQTQTQQPLTQSKRTYKKKNEIEYTEMVSINYQIPENHPFFFLNGMQDSVAIESIIGTFTIYKNEVIRFAKEIDGVYQLVNATIEDNRSFQIPKNKTGKLIRPEMNDLTSNSVISALVKMKEMQTGNEKLTNSSEKNSKILEKIPSSVNEDEDFTQPINNKKFLITLKKELQLHFGSKKKDVLPYPNDTYKNYEDKYPIIILSIENSLKRFVPAGLSFKEALRRAKKSLTVEKATKEKNECKRKCNQE